MNQLVRDLMTKEVAVIGTDRELHEIEKLLLDNGVHGAPVVDKDERIVGVVSQTDLLAWHFKAGIDGAPFYDRELDRTALHEHGRLRVSDIRTASVAEVMSPVIHAIGPDKPVAEAARRMIRERIHRLVVVDEGFRVVGILSALDLLRALDGVQPVSPVQSPPCKTCKN